MRPRAGQLVVVEAKVEPEDKRENGDDEEDDEEAPPFQLAGPACADDALVELHVALPRIVLHIGRLLLDLLHRRLLQDDLLREVLEELVELDESPLDLLYVVVAGSH